jgi:hypothetical protein
MMIVLDTTAAANNKRAAVAVIALLAAALPRAGGLAAAHDDGLPGTTIVVAVVRRSGEDGALLPAAPAVWEKEPCWSWLEFASCPRRAVDPGNFIRACGKPHTGVPFATVEPNVPLNVAL